jgi:YbbR domain-containing protein
LDRWFEKDATVRVLSVVLAFVLWFQVTAEQNPTTPRTFKTVTIKVHNLDSSLVLMDMTPKTVQVTVQAQRRTVAALKDEEVTASVDLKSVDAGKANVPIEIFVPKGISITEVSPTQAAVTADNTSRKRLRLEVRSVGNPADDYMALAGQTTRATDVTVEGPKTRVALVTRVVADVDIAGATADVTKTVTLRALDVDGREIRDVSMTPKTVEAKIPMRKLPPAKTVTVKAEVAGVPKEGYKVSSVQVDPVSVKIRGPAEVIAKIDSVSANPVQVKGIATDFDRQSDIVLPPGVSMAEPKTVTIRVSIVEDRIEKTIQRVPVQVKNVSSAYKWTSTPTEITVNVEGKRALVDRLTAKTTQVFVDAFGLLEGDHVLYIQTSLPDGVVLQGISADTLILRVRKK